MRRLDRDLRGFAIGLAAVAGYVDAIAFVDLGGFFVSFMSGNSTRLGVALAERSRGAVVAAGLIASFVAGVAAGSLLGTRMGARRMTGLPVALAALIAIAILLAGAGLRTPAFALLAVAMGAENAIFEREGQVRVGLTYMTGALVKAGQYLAARLAGRAAPGGWIDALLWLGLVTGATLGAAAHAFVGLAALWLAVIALLILAIASARAGHFADR